MDILVAEKTLPAKKQDPVIKLMGDTLARMKEGAQANNIVPFEIVPASCYFKKSIEIITPQPNHLSRLRDN